ncbi:2'-5' RNA ligase family protein, partial [Aeromonas jandaei]
LFAPSLNQYSKVIHELFQKIPPFQIDLKGVLFTDVGGFVKGFDCLNLHHIRKEIREKMTAAKLPFQERYESKIAHITFCRYKDELTHPYKLQQVNQKLREHYLDTLQITEVSLVIHDCYNLKSKTKIVASIPLGGKNKQFIVQRPIIITP